MGAAPAGPGFTFWGLFVACAAILAGYAAWMWWTERRR
jgi:hypothetical protein